MLNEVGLKVELNPIDAFECHKEFVVINTKNTLFCLVAFLLGAAFC